MGDSYVKTWTKNEAWKATARDYCVLGVSGAQASNMLTKISKAKLEYPVPRFINEIGKFFSLFLVVEVLFIY